MLDPDEMNCKIVFGGGGGPCDSILKYCGKINVPTRKFTCLSALSKDLIVYPTTLINRVDLRIYEHLKIGFTLLILALLAILAF
jgi:hypothetical protein